MADLKILIDIRKNRIRVYKSTLRALGNPAYLSLVINPDEYSLGITAGSANDRTAHRIRTSVMTTKESCELYSSTLIRALLSLCPDWHPYGKYRMSGMLIPEANMVRFYMKAAVFEETRQVSRCYTQLTR